MSYRIEHRIGVAAPAEVIWDILADVPGWEAWNPLYSSASGTIRIGEVLNLTRVLRGQKPEAIAPRVLDWVPLEQLHWYSTAGNGLLKALRYIEIEQLDEASCIFSNGELFSGLLGPFAAKRLKGELRAGFAAMGEAMKAQAEAAYAKQPKKKKPKTAARKADPKPIAPIQPIAVKAIGRHKALYRPGAR